MTTDNHLGEYLRAREGALTVAQHPEVGELALLEERLVVEGADDLVLVMFHSADDQTADKLAILSSMVPVAGTR